MIINMSRAATFLQCRRKSYNEQIIHLSSWQTAAPLAIGGAYHEAVAYLTAKKNEEGAVAIAEKFYRDKIAGEKYLPEELVIVEQNIELTKRMLRAQAAVYKKQDWELLQPEIAFCVELPNTQHHCAFVHEILYPASAANPQCNDLRCMTNHRLKGRVDGLLSWKSMIWVMERKTSGMKQESFWTQWQLAAQPTAYVYGTWRSAGIRPHGFILEKTQKPAKNQDPFDIKIEMEPFLRSDADLLEFESDISQIATDYERAYVDGTWYKNTASCLNWNRKCYFHDLCKRNQEQAAGEFRERKRDYVDKEYYTLLNLPLPTGDVWSDTEAPVETDPQ